MLRLSRAFGLPADRRDGIGITVVVVLRPVLEWVVRAFSALDPHTQKVRGSRRIP
jgi:hypothetical protein